MSTAKKRKLDDEGGLFNSEWAQNILLSHTTNVLSASLYYCNHQSIMLNVITRVSTPPSLIKLLVRHDWTKLNI